MLRGGATLSISSPENQQTQEQMVCNYFWRVEGAARRSGEWKGPPAGAYLQLLEQTAGRLPTHPTHQDTLSLPARVGEPVGPAVSFPGWSP